MTVPVCPRCSAVYMRQKGDDEIMGTVLFDCPCGHHERFAVTRDRTCGECEETWSTNQHDDYLCPNCRAGLEHVAAEPGQSL